mmetsp:Transcript_57638/g.185170  ORF Transcript_57638/g.185170 Transcript_57638/m.185170 type:complete len:181 (+) Transcript_57638:153-695(+)
MRKAAPPPDEGFTRAALASDELSKPWFSSTLVQLGATRSAGRPLVSPTRARALAKGGGACSPWLLQSSYRQLQESLATAQRAAFPTYPDRWLELQHVDDLTRFLSRADVSVLSRREVSNLGKALAAAQFAGHDARMDYAAQLKKSQEGVADQLAGAIANAQMDMRSVAAHGFRCRATAFL